MKRKTPPMFASTSEDLPLFSGACVRADVQVFAPAEVVDAGPTLFELPTIELHRLRQTTRSRDTQDRIDHELLSRDKLDVSEIVQC